MSKGPGRVSRAIGTALEGEPDNAFTIEDLSDRVYRGINRVEKNFTRLAGLPLCNDPMGVDRASVHKQVTRDVVAFFDRNLARAD